jgi:O-antigen/teichoic acid export membrane protein
MAILNRLKNSKAGRNFGASIFAFVTRMISGLVSIPIAVHYFSKEELGLWASVSAMVGYLMWMDLGVGDATGRKLANAVVAEDPEQINIWWTATQMALWALGGLTVLVGLCIAPFFTYLFNVPPALTHDAWVLFIGIVLCVGLNFPLRGAPGLLTAQERFHWVPIGQAFAPWIQIGVFVCMLWAGHGLSAYIYGNAAAQLFSFIYFRVLIASSAIRPRYVRKGVTKAHFRELFGFSLNLAVIGLKTSFIGSLPVLVLARMAGIGAIPIYTISSRVPGIFRSLSGRVNHSFLPELINLHVAGRHELFLAKYRRSMLLASSVALLGAAAILLINRSLVTVLAGPDFYAGDQITVWFSLFLVIVTVTSGLESLLKISGNMGKSIPLALASVLIMLVAAPLGFKFFGMAGLAAVFAFQPISYGIYGLVRGARNCGYSLSGFTSLLTVAGVLPAASVICVGSFMDSSHPLGDSLLLFGKTVLLPSVSQIVCSGILVGIAGLLAWLGVASRNERSAVTHMKKIVLES